MKMEYPLYIICLEQLKTKITENDGQVPRFSMPHVPKTLMVVLIFKSNKLKQDCMIFFVFLSLILNWVEEKNTTRCSPQGDYGN